MFKKLSKTEYKDLFDKASFKTFFHNPEWHEFLEKEFKWLKFEYYQYKNEAFLPLARFKVSGTEKLVSLPFCEYGGPLPLKGDINWEDFSKDVFNEFGNNIKIKIHPRIKNGRNSEVSTHWIENLDKLSAEQIFDSFRKTTRHSIRNSYLFLESHVYKRGEVIMPQDIYAPEESLNIKKCSSPTELKQFYNLYAINLKNKKTIPYPLSFVKHLYNQADTELLLYIYGNKVIAGCLFLHYSGFVHYFLSASDHKFRNLGANYKILWTKIEKSVGGNYKVFDLGASPQGSSLEIFKRGWGGTEYPIYQIGAKKSPAHAKASADREESLRSSKLRNIWGLLPKFVIKKMSRYLIKYRI